MNTLRALRLSLADPFTWSHANAVNLWLLPSRAIAAPTAAMRRWLPRVEKKGPCPLLAAVATLPLSVVALPVVALVIRQGTRIGIDAAVTSRGGRRVSTDRHGGRRCCARRHEGSIQGGFHTQGALRTRCEAAGPFLLP